MKVVKDIRNLKEVQELTSHPLHEPQMGFSFISIYPTVKFGKNTTIGNFNTIYDGVVLGSNAVIEDNVFIGQESQIGARTKIGSGCIIGEGVVIGNDCNVEPNCYIGDGSVIGCKVAIGAGVVIVDDRTIAYKRKHLDWKGGNLVINTGSRIGARSVILTTEEIGKNVLIFPASVVHQGIERNHIVSGNPAIIIGTVKKEDRIY